MTTPNGPRDSAYQQLVAAVLQDPSLRDRVKADPRGVIESEFNVTLPPGVEIEVLEESATKSYLLLPAAVDSGERELSDDELATVAGGNTGSLDVDCWVSCKKG